MIYESTNIQVSYATSEIAELCFNHHTSVNKLDRSTLQALVEALDAIEQQESIKGLVLTSNKKDFLVGADIMEFLEYFALPEAELSTWLEQTNALFSRLEDLPFPTVSAVTGFALGGGCETILATDYRLADDSIQVGLPEVKLGIMPGFGGTVRLPRLIGADNAIEWITSGKTYRAKAALAVGFVDAIIDSQQTTLKDAAIQLLNSVLAEGRDWQHQRQRKTQPLSLGKLESTLSFVTAKALVAQKAGRHYPAPLTAVACIEDAANDERSAALAKENASFTALAKTPQATALVGLFLNDQYLKSLVKKAQPAAQPIAKAAVLGAGIMGGGIAYQAAQKGTPTVLKDISAKALDAGISEAAKRLEQRVQRGKMTTMEMASALARITPTLNYTELQDVDIVVEAVVENADVKRKVLSELEMQLQVDQETILASNTSTIEIGQLASALKKPERCCGMHFFNPVHKMPLVEVIKGPQTDEQTLATVMAWAASLGKIPIRVNDCPGFFVNRVLFPYFAGFNLLLVDGADFITVDRVLERQFGWPMGPAYLLDVVGMDTAAHAQQVMAKGFPQRMTPPETNVVDLLYRAGRLGQKSGKGFYQYNEVKGKAEKGIDEQTHELLTPLAIHHKDFDPQTIIARVMVPMVLETVRCLEEGIIASPAEADMALIYGLGFPPFHGGVFRYLDTMGLDTFINQADQLAGLGAMYQVTPEMRDRAQQGKTYYSSSAQ